MELLQCFVCVHLDKTPDDPVLRCKAFPGGVPMAIQLKDHDHSQPYPGDNGILYEFVGWLPERPTTPPAP